MNFIRRLLTPASFLYGAGIWIRNKLFDFNILKAKHPGVFVISIGNLSVGGTGKTQVSIYLAKALKELNPCIVLRGYKRASRENLIVSSYDAKTYGDEAVEIFLKTKANVVVAFKRIEGAEICKKLGSKIIILDDAFSHRYIKRDLDILLMPANRMKDRLLPLGNLREPYSSMNRADALIITRLESFDMPTLSINKPIFGAKAFFRAFVDKNFEDVDISYVKGKSFSIVCAIGDEKPFIRLVENLSKDIGFKIEDVKIFPDHYFYKKEDLESNKNYICTTKDLVKLRDFDQFILGVDTTLDIPGFIDFIKNKYEKT
ncbi:MAG TPA: tetraacyldisaccharide 4'-kinase [Hydrogenobaculum sp.]|nr:tetraacyldisaccharide 4'-kinase [Hydrogenobaculum sp.]